MPFKSKAQRALFIQKEKSGELPSGTVKRWDAETYGHLPEKLSAFSPAAAKASGTVGAIAGAAHGAMHPDDNLPVSVVKDALVAGIASGVLGGLAIGAGRQKIIDLLSKAKAAMMKAKTKDVFFKK